MTTGVVVGGIFLSSDQLLRMEELAVGSCTDLICEQTTLSIQSAVATLFASENSNCTDDRWLQVHKDSSRNMFASSSFSEEGVEGVISSTDGLVAGHLTVRLDAVLQAVELPACIAHLDTCLTNMDGEAFTLLECKKKR